MSATDASQPPIPGPSTDPRSGLPVHENCRPLLPLIGVWRGTGQVDYPTIDGPYRFGQQVTISHDGRPFLRHEARAWLLHDDGSVLRPAAWETGWWRPQPDGRFELLLTHNTGILELFYGHTDTGGWLLETDLVMPSASAKDVQAAQRAYLLPSDDILDYTEHRAMVGEAMTPHVSAELRRLAPGS